MGGGRWGGGCRCLGIVCGCGPFLGVDGDLVVGLVVARVVGLVLELSRDLMSKGVVMDDVIVWRRVWTRGCVRGMGGVMIRIISVGVWSFEVEVVGGTARKESRSANLIP